MRRGTLVRRHEQNHPRAGSVERRRRSAMAATLFMEPAYNALPPLAQAAENLEPRRVVGENVRDSGHSLVSQQSCGHSD
jgi:hypothetical protein